MVTKALKTALRKAPGAAALARRLDARFGLRARHALSRSRSRERVDPDVFVPRMLRYWKETLGVSERTTADWLVTALDYDRYEGDIAYIESQFGALAGQSVLDVGCGWGTFLLLLAEKGAAVQACDIPAHHVEVARLRVPQARVEQGDARVLEAFADGTFDLVLEHDVFEHVGDHQGDTGPMARSRPDKLQNLLALKRVLKPGGRGFISTGNFAFPFNGEVRLWAVHWLPFAHQERYLQSLGLDSDRYWLCTWAEARDLFQEAGLEIEDVSTPEGDARGFRDRIMHCLRGEPGANEVLGEILLELMTTRPEFMPSWRICFRKPV